MALVTTVLLTPPTLRYPSWRHDSGNIPGDWTQKHPYRRKLAYFRNVCKFPYPALRAIYLFIR